MTASAITTIGQTLTADLMAWGAAALALAVVVAGVKWIMRLLS
ncbi:MAG: hypothetical protein AB1411_09475 [Nitrospirota bacterium]